VAGLLMGPDSIDFVMMKEEDFVSASYSFLTVYNICTYISV